MQPIHCDIDHPSRQKIVSTIQLDVDISIFEPTFRAIPFEILIYLPKWICIVLGKYIVLGLRMLCATWGHHSCVYNRFTDCSSPCVKEMDDNAK